MINVLKKVDKFTFLLRNVEIATITFLFLKKDIIFEKIYILRKEKCEVDISKGINIETKGA